VRYWGTCQGILPEGKVVRSGGENVSPIWGYSCRGAGKEVCGFLFVNASNTGGDAKGAVHPCRTKVRKENFGGI